MEQYDLNTSHNILRDIGAKLASERDRQGLTIANVSQRLRILEDHLTFIEAGKLDKLPAMTYVIGYVRSYARLLKLDDGKLCADLKNSLTAEQGKPEFDFIETRLDQKTGAGRVALAAVIAGVLIYGGWYTISVTPSSDIDIADVSPAATQQVVIADTEETPEAIEATPAPTFVAVAPRVDELVEETAAVTEDAPAVTTEDTAVSAPTDTSPLGQEVTADLAQPQSDEAVKVTDAFAVNRTPDAEIIIEAIANSWVEVTRADGTPVTSRLMRLGDTYLIPSDEDLFLTTGNAGGLNLRMGKDDPFTLGTWGEALRELPLNKAIISTRY